MTRQDAVGKIRFPYVTLCSWEFLDPGMKASWFENADAHLYHDWSDTYGEYSDTELEVSYVNASDLYKRDGVCLQADASKQKMTHKAYSDWFSLQFDFTPSYDEFCQKFEDDDPTTCAVYSEDAGNVVGGGYVTEVFELIFEVFEPCHHPHVYPSPSPSLLALPSTVTSTTPNRMPSTSGTITTRCW